MNNSNITNAARVPASLKFLALAASILVPASAFAQAEDSYGITPPESDSSVFLQSASLKVFYGAGLKKPIKDVEVPRVDLVGVTAEYEWELNRYIDFVAALSFGGGSSDYERTEYDIASYYKEKAEVKLSTYELEVGANFTVPIGKRFAFFVGPRVGANLLYADVDWKAYNSGTGRSAHMRRSNTDFGFLYGVDLGATISFTKHHGMTFGVGYRASTAQPEAGGEKIDEQSWVRVSLGYRFSF